MNAKVKAPPKPTAPQRRVMVRLATGEPVESALLSEIQNSKNAMAMRATLGRRGWLKDGYLTAEGAEAIGHNPEPFRLPPPPPVTIERVELPPAVLVEAHPETGTQITVRRRRSAPKSTVLADPDLQQECQVTPEEVRAGVIADLVHEQGATTIEVALDLDRPRGALAEVLEREHKTEAGREAQALHDRLVAKAREVQSGYMALAALVAEAYTQRVWEFFGVLAPETYFEGTIGLKIRTVLALKSIHEGVQRLPEPERPLAIAALSEIGRHKATVLAPVLGNSETPWTEWVATAKALPEKSLQAAVSQATGAARGRVGAERDYAQEYMDKVIAGLHPNHQRRAKVVWLAYGGWLADKAGRPQPLLPQASLMAMIGLAEKALAEDGIEVQVDDA